MVCVFVFVGKIRKTFWIDFSIRISSEKIVFFSMSHLLLTKDKMQGKLFQRCTHLLYCSVLSLGGKVNTRRMSKPEMGSMFHIKKQ